MTPTHTHLLRGATAVALALTLAACASAADTADDGGGVSSAVCAPDTPDCEDTVVVNDGDEPMTSGMCVEDEPDCEDMVVVDDGDAAAGSCLAGDEDCTDESYGGQDVTRPVRLVQDIQEETTPATRGTTSGASGVVVEQAALVDADTVRLVFVGSQCTLVEDVLVTESPAEVRVLVLAGQDAEVEDCEDEGLWLTVDVDLAEPLGDRMLLDLAG